LRFSGARMVSHAPLPHEPANADGAGGARFVPNRSADIGTGAEPTQTRGLAERCELGQLALRRQGRFMIGGQVRKEQATFQEPLKMVERNTSPRPSPHFAPLTVRRGSPYAPQNAEREKRLPRPGKLATSDLSRLRRSMRGSFREILSMNRETPTVQSERGLSQTAARMLARALNLLRRVAWRSAASWDNSRSGAKAGSWPVSRSERNKELPMNPKMVRSGPDLNLSLFAARGRDVALPSSSKFDGTRRCPRRPAQGRRSARAVPKHLRCAAFRRRPSGPSLPGLPPPCP
jgi:hypothetical protein